VTGLLGIQVINSLFFSLTGCSTRRPTVIVRKSLNTN